MSAADSTPTTPPLTSPRYDRAASTQLLDDCLDQRQRLGRSCRQFARQQALPRSTLQYWHARRRRCDLDPAVTAFFESPAGLAFLHQLQTALHLVFAQQGCAGLRLISAFLRLTSLDRFLAASFGAQQKAAVALERAVLDFAAGERRRLAAGMPGRAITACQDETFHPACCLVALEPVSNFLLLERYAQARDEAAWNEAMRQALQGLPVTVRQAVSDEAKGLLAHARNGLGVPHAPDLFHLQHELCKAMAAALARRTRQAEQELLRAQQAAQRVGEEAEQARRLPRAGRPKDYGWRVELCQGAERQAAEQVQRCQRQQEELRQALAGLSAAYHPFELPTGKPVAAPALEQELQAQLDRLEGLAREAELGEAAQQALGKVRRAAGGLVAALAFFWSSVGQVASGLPEGLRQVWLGQLLAGAYLLQAGKRLAGATARTAVQRLGEALAAVACPAGVAAWTWRQLRQQAEQCAGWFVRGSSSVEGRNGVLELRHRHLHRLSDRKLGVLTALHNYWIKRPDGTTAAERFFGQPPRDLFRHLVQTLPLPARPAKRRSRAA